MIRSFHALAWYWNSVNATLDFDAKSGDQR
jgi:hypothetical protein